MCKVKDHRGLEKDRGFSNVGGRSAAFSNRQQGSLGPHAKAFRFEY